MRTAAVLPVKSFGRAKQRLGAAVAAPERAELARTMLDDVLAALGAVAGLDELIVVTSEERAAEAARAAGARVVADPDEAGQSHAAATPSAAGVASLYPGLLDGMVTDDQGPIEGLAVHRCPTLMSDAAGRAPQI